MLLLCGNNTSWGNQPLRSVLSRWKTECYCSVGTTQVEVTNLWGVSYLSERLSVTVVWEDLGDNTSWSDQPPRSVLSRWKTECYCVTGNFWGVSYPGERLSSLILQYYWLFYSIFTIDLFNSICRIDTKNKFGNLLKRTLLLRNIQGLNKNELNNWVC